MKRHRRGWFSFLTDWMIRLKGDRPDAADQQRRRARQSFETDTSKLGVRMSESLRDRLRRRWIKIKR